MTMRRRVIHDRGDGREQAGERRRSGVRHPGLLDVAPRSRFTIAADVRAHQTCCGRIHGPRATCRLRLTAARPSLRADRSLAANGAQSRLGCPACAAQSGSRRCTALPRTSPRLTRTSPANYREGRSLPHVQRPQSRASMLADRQAAERRAAAGSGSASNLLSCRLIRREHSHSLKMLPVMFAGPYCQ